MQIASPRSTGEKSNRSAQAGDVPGRPASRTNSAWRPAVRIAAVYAGVSVAWILITDQLAAKLASTQETLVWVENVKGVGFVLLSSGLIAWLVSRSARRFLQA